MKEHINVEQMILADTLRDVVTPEANPLLPGQWTP